MNHRYDLFKQRRRQLGYTFGDVSKISGLAKGTVIAAEKRSGNPQASTLKRLSKCYGLDPASSMNFKLRLPSDIHLAVVNGAG